MICPRLVAGILDTHLDVGMEQAPGSDVTIAYKGLVFVVREVLSYYSVDRIIDQ